MLKTIIVLPDGTELHSGVDAENAVQSATITECVNEGQELTLGSTCASALEAKIYAPNGALQIAAGDELTVYKEDDEGFRYLIGEFTTEKPTYPSANTMSLTAYDRISWLDKDLTSWLAALAGWPYKLYDFASLVCDACNLDLRNETLPNGDYEIAQFSGQGITGRQLLRWVGQIAGRFCRATSSGGIAFDWYTDSGVEITPGGGRYYYQNGLSFEDYEVAPIEKVQIKLTEDDVGAVWPQDSAEKNAYVITGNYLLTTQSTEALLPIAQALYEQLKDVTYRPCKISLPASLEIHAGNTVQITDRNGKTFTSYVMTKTQSGQRDTLECTGSARRDSVSAVNQESYKALAGKMLELKKTADGILSRVSQVEQQAAGTNERLTKVEQTANSLDVSVQNIQENGTTKVTTTTGFTFNEEGMTVYKSNTELQTKITENGMRVSRGTTDMLTANETGVVAKNLDASTYLIVGGRSRFENYGSNRTGCFWIGGS